MLQFSIKFGKGKLLSIFFMPWILQFIYCYRLSGKPSIDPGTDDKLREMPFQPQHLCLWQGLPVSLVLYQLLSFMSTNLDFAGPFWGELNCHGHHVSTADSYRIAGLGVETMEKNGHLHKDWSRS